MYEIFTATWINVGNLKGRPKVGRYPLWAYYSLDESRRIQIISDAKIINGKRSIYDQSTK